MPPNSMIGRLMTVLGTAFLGYHLNSFDSAELFLGTIDLGVLYFCRLVANRISVVTVVMNNYYFYRFIMLLTDM